MNDDLQWEEVVSTKKFAYVTVSCKRSEKTGDVKVNVSLTAEIVKKLGWPLDDTKHVQCMTAVDPNTNKRLLQFIRKNAKSASTISMQKKLHGSAMLTLWNMSWMPAWNVVKTNVFHQEEHAENGILRIELPVSFMKKPEGVQESSGDDDDDDESSAPANPAPQQPTVASKVMEAPVKVSKVVDQIVPANDKRAVLGKARMHACSPEITADDYLITSFNGKRAEVKIQSATMQVLREMVLAQERGDLFNHTQFLQLLSAKGHKLKLGDSVPDWISKINSAYLERSHLRMKHAQEYVYLTTADA